MTKLRSQFCCFARAKVWQNFLKFHKILSKFHLSPFAKQGHSHKGELLKNFMPNLDKHHFDTINNYTNLVVKQVWVAFPQHPHVVFKVHPKPYRPSKLIGCNSWSSHCCILHVNFASIGTTKPFDWEVDSKIFILIDLLFKLKIQFYI